MIAQYLAQKFINAIALVIIFTMIFCIFIKLTYDYVKSNKGIESKQRINPELRLEVNGMKIDTIYIYKTKK